MSTCSGILNKFSLARSQLLPLTVVHTNRCLRHIWHLDYKGRIKYAFVIILCLAKDITGYKLIFIAILHENRVRCKVLNDRLACLGYHIKCKASHI